jgi:putative transposase
MAIGDDTFATRRHLPHLGRTGATYFVTFSTIERLMLTPAARDVTLDCCIHDHNRTYFLHCVVIMPDHVHMLLTPHDQWTLPDSPTR